MTKGQTSLEMFAVVIVILLMFLTVYIGVFKRGEDIAAYRRGAELQGAVDRVAAFMSVAQIAPGVRFNTTLPTVFEGCTPSYKVHASLVVATCADNAYASRYLAANVTNGTSAPPFNISGDVRVENRNGVVVMTP